MEWYSKELGAKNFAAMSQGLKDLRAQLSEEQKQKEIIITQMIQMRQQMEAMQQKVNIMFAKSIGNGATT